MSKKTAPCRPGETVELEVAGMAGAEALARLDGYPVFVADAVPGDRIRARVISAKPTYARARLEEVLTPSAERIVSPCSIVKACGGCQWGQMAYAEQLRWKERALAETLARIGGEQAAVNVRPIVASPRPLRYRNKNQFVMGSYRKRLFAGFYRPRSHDPIEVPECYQQPEELDAALAVIMRQLQAEQLTAYDETTGHGFLRHLILRRGEATGEILVGLVTRTRGRDSLARVAGAIRAALPAVVGVVQNVNQEQTNAILGPEYVLLKGRDHYFEELAGLRFQVSLPSFFQVNTAQAGALLQTIGRQAALRGDELVWDAYAGVGAIALHLARQARQVLAIEEAPSAVRDAQANAALNHIANVEQHAGTVESLLPRQLAGGPAPDLLVLDPPRAGCAPEVLAAVAASAIPRVIYTSCHPATLARDLARLLEAGFAVKEVQPIDMFPQTYHLEAVTLLER